MLETPATESMALMPPPQQPEALEPLVTKPQSIPTPVSSLLEQRELLALMAPQEFREPLGRMDSVVAL